MLRPNLNHGHPHCSRCGYVISLAFQEKDATPIGDDWYHNKCLDEMREDRVEREQSLRDCW